MEMHHRSEPAQPHGPIIQIQDGDSGFLEKCGPARRFRCIGRPSRCVFARPDTQVFTKVPEVCSRGNSVRIHLSSGRPQQQSSSLHDGDGHGYDASKIAVRSLLFSLPGRRPYERKKQGTTAKSVELFPLTNSQIGPANQPREVSAGAVTRLHQCGYALSDSAKPSETSRRQSGEACQVCEGFPGFADPTARDFLVLLGTLNAAADLLVLGRLRMRPIQFHLLAKALSSGPSRSYIGRDTGCLHSMVEPQVVNGRSAHLSPPGSTCLNDRRQPFRMGAVLLPQKAEASVHWNCSEADLHINILELKAVFLALKAFLPAVRYKPVMLRTDNTTVAAYIKKQGGTRSPHMTVIIWDLLWWCRDNGITLTVSHISGARNVRADALSRSRQVATTEWSLHPWVFKQINLLYGDLNIDLFATDLNHKLPVYVSPCPDPKAWAVDALSVSWTGMAAYAFPPFPLLPKVLLKIREDKANVILVAPWWPQKILDKNLLLDLVRDFQRVLPLWPKLLKQPR